MTNAFWCDFFCSQFQLLFTCKTRMLSFTRWVLRWGGKRLYFCMTNLLRTTCTKFYHNRPGFVDCISKNMLVCFLVHSVDAGAGEFPNFRCLYWRGGLLFVSWIPVRQSYRNGWEGSSAIGNVNGTIYRANRLMLQCYNGTRLHPWWWRVDMLGHTQPAAAAATINWPLTTLTTTRLLIRRH